MSKAQDLMAHVRRYKSVSEGNVSEMSYKAKAGLNTVIKYGGMAAGIMLGSHLMGALGHADTGIDAHDNPAQPAHPGTSDWERAQQHSHGPTGGVSPHGDAWKPGDKGVAAHTPKMMHGQGPIISTKDQITQSPIEPTQSYGGAGEKSGFELAQQHQGGGDEHPIEQTRTPNTANPQVGAGPHRRPTAAFSLIQATANGPSKGSYGPNVIPQAPGHIKTDASGIKQW